MFKEEPKVIDWGSLRVGDQFTTVNTYTVIQEMSLNSHLWARNNKTQARAAFRETTVEGFVASRAVAVGDTVRVNTGTDTGNRYVVLSIDGNVAFIKSTNECCHYVRALAGLMRVQP